jgi:hypothetical protein
MLPLVNTLWLFKELYSFFCQKLWDNVITLYPYCNHGVFNYRDQTGRQNFSSSQVKKFNRGTNFAFRKFDCETNFGPPIAKICLGYKVCGSLNIFDVFPLKYSWWIGIFLTPLLTPPQPHFSCPYSSRQFFLVWFTQNLSDKKYISLFPTTTVILFNFGNIWKES